MKNDKHIIGLDSMRGLAILMVFTFHLLESFFRGNPEFDTQAILQFPASYPSFAPYLFTIHPRFGIHLFFVISGYIIHALYNKYYFDTYNSKVFILKRLIRMAPAYYVSIIIALIGLYMVGRIQSINFIDVLYHVLFIHNYFDEYSYTIQAVYWTMGVEFQFYVLYAVIRFLLKDKFNLTYVFIAFLLFSFAFRIYNYDPELAQLNNWNFMDNTLVRFSDWLLGAMLFEYRKKIFALPYKFLIGLVLVLTASYMAYFGFWDNVFLDFTASLGMIFLLAEVLDKKLESKFLKFVGLISYSLYLYHFMCYSMIDQLGLYIFDYPRTAYSWVRFGMFLSAIPITLFFSYIMYKLIEEPSFRIFKQKMK